MKFNGKYQKTKKGLAIGSLCFFSIILLLFLLMNGIQIDIQIGNNNKTQITKVYNQLVHLLTGLSILSLIRIINTDLIKPSTPTTPSATTGDNVVYAILFLVFFTIIILLIVMSALSIRNSKKGYKSSIVTGVLILIYAVLISGQMLLAHEGYAIRYISITMVTSIIFIIFGSSMIFVGYSNNKRARSTNTQKASTRK